MVVEVMGGEVLVGSGKKGGGGRRLYQYSERRESVRCTELPSALSPTRSRELSSIQTSRLGLNPLPGSRLLVGHGVFTVCESPHRATRMTRTKRENSAEPVEMVIGLERWNSRSMLAFYGGVEAAGGAGNRTVRHREPTWALRSVRPFLH